MARPGPQPTLEKVFQMAQEVSRRPLIRIAPEDNTLVGFHTISRYLCIKSWATLYQWVELYGFPAIKRPDGQWMTTMTAIDQWIFLASEVDNENRAHSRGYSKRHDIALRRLESRVAEAQGRGPGQAASDGPRGVGPRAASPPGGERNVSRPSRGQDEAIQAEEGPWPNGPSEAGTKA